MDPGHCIVIFILVITTNNTEYEQFIFAGEMCVYACMHISFDLFRLREMASYLEDSRWYWPTVCRNIESRNSAFLYPFFCRVTHIKTIAPLKELDTRIVTRRINVSVYL